MGFRFPETLNFPSCCSPRELVSFVRHRELVSFGPKHVTRSPPIGVELGGITTTL